MYFKLFHVFIVFYIFWGALGGEKQIIKSNK